MRTNLRALRPTLDRLELDRLHTVPWLASPSASGPGLKRARRHPDTPAAISPASKAQPGPHRGFYAEVGDRLQAARRFAGLHAVARAAGLASDAAATAAIAWMTGGAYGHGGRGHALAPVAPVRGEVEGGLDRGYVRGTLAGAIRARDQGRQGAR